MENQNFSDLNGYQGAEESPRSEFQVDEPMNHHSQSSNNDSYQIHGDSQQDDSLAEDDLPNFNAHLTLGNTLAPCDKPSVYAKIEELQYIEQMNYKEQPDKNHPLNLCFACSCCNHNKHGACLTQPKARRDSTNRPVRSKLSLCPPKQATTTSAKSSAPMLSTTISLFCGKAKFPSNQPFENKIKNIRFNPRDLLRIVFKSLDLKDKYASRQILIKKLKQFVTEMEGKCVIIRGQPSKKARAHIKKKINHLVDRITNILYPKGIRSEKANRRLLFEILDAVLNTAINYLTFPGKNSFKVFYEMLSGGEECLFLIRRGFKSLF